MDILDQVRVLLKPRSGITYRALGFKAPAHCIPGCKCRTQDIVDFVGDRLENIPTCTHPKARIGYCPVGGKV